MRLSFTDPTSPALRWLVVTGLALLVVAPLFLPPFYVRILQQVFLFGGMAVAWGLLGGFTTYWSFGHAGFVGLGAFAAGLLELRLDPGLAPVVRMSIGTGFAAVTAAGVAVLLALPMLRLRGIYFAIGMLAFAEILAECSKAFGFFQGSMGFMLPNVALFGLNKAQTFYYLFLLLLVVNGVVFEVVRRSRLGIGLVCVGQDEDTAAMMGVPTERYKLLAFVMSAVLTAIGGALFAHSLGFVTTASVFRTEISLNLILYSMLGGVGTLAGPVVGAALMIVLTQVVLGNLLDMHMLLTGLVFIVIVIGAPGGLVGVLRNRLGLARQGEVAA
jgi:branched-chain amino acid transport system permease protein